MLSFQLDGELKNIVDKLAVFVARNGPEFEQMTKQKQKDNPRFSFLFGGEHFNYYQYRVTTEQASRCQLNLLNINLIIYLAFKHYASLFSKDKYHSSIIKGPFILEVE